MGHVVILGGGTAGTIAANRLRRRLDRDTWHITVVDGDDEHVYQPGLLMVPFGEYQRSDLIRARHRQLAAGVRLVRDRAERVTPADHLVRLASGELLPYTYLVIATGTAPHPEQTPGLLGPQWGRTVHEFYTVDGAERLAAALRRFDGGRVVIDVVDMPIKCPVAPLEFTFLLDAHLRRRGLRGSTELTYATPLPGAFTRPVAAHLLGSMLTDRGVTVEPDFMVEHVTDDTVVSYDGRRIGYDLLVTVPLNMGADHVAASGLGDELNHVPVDRHTLRANGHDDIYALGDANDVPTSKAGSVAHVEAELFADALAARVHGHPSPAEFDGHANCFVECGDGRALLLDFNYDTEPLPGSYPLPGIGPFRLLRPTRLNHWGKHAFRWIYWHALLPGRPLPLPARMTMAGKHQPQEVAS